MADGMRVGFVGVGRMGGPMCARLLDAGYRVSVFDTDPQAIAAVVARGAEAARSVSEVASQAAVVLVSLPTPAIVESVVLGDAGLVSGTTVRTIIDLSTSGPGASSRIATALAANRIGIDTCLRYAREQGLVGRAYKAEELFWSGA